MTAIQIGSYCSDFILTDPAASDGTRYYMRKDATTNQAYYLTLDGTGVYREIANPIEQPATPYVIADFEITLLWDKTIKPVTSLSATTITSAYELRYVRTTPQQARTATVVLFDSSDNSITFRKNAAGTRVLSSYSTVADTIVEKFYMTSIPPSSVDRGAGVYLVNDADDNSAIISKTTTTRYLVVNPANPGVPMSLDLFTPGVTEKMIKRTVYRINKRTSLAPGGAVSFSFDVFRGSDFVNLPTPPTTNVNTKYFELTDMNRVYTIANPADSTLASPFMGLKVVVTYMGTTETYVVTQTVADKSLADLFGDFSLGLFRLYYNGLDTNKYLGIDCTSVSSSGACNTGSAKQLTVNDYYRFRNPAASCQYKRYNLGGSNEFMFLVNDPDDMLNISKRMTLRVNSTSSVVEYPVNYSPTLDERGWQVIKQSAIGGGVVKLKWNYPGQDVEMSTAPSAAFLKIDNNVVSIVAEGSANTFVCVECSFIDPGTGTCSPDNYTYIDADMDAATTPTPMSSISLNIAQTAPVKIRDGIAIIEVSTSNRMNVSDDGVISFTAVSTDTFFTTQTGVNTAAERRRNIVFIGTPSSSGGEFLYAKSTGSTTKFVLGTNPTVEDGFGWIITDDATDPNRKTITSSITSSYIFNGSAASGLSFSVVNPKIVPTLKTYDKERNLWGIDVTYTLQGAEYDPVTIYYRMPSGATDVIFQGSGGTLSGGSIPAHASPTSVIYTIRGTCNTPTGIAPISGGTTDIVVPITPAPSYSGTTASDISYDSIKIKNTIINNLNLAGTVTLTPAPTAGGAALSPVSGLYSDFSSETGITVIGLSGLTAYTIGVRAVHSMNGIATSFSLPSITTTAAPTITSVSVSGSTISYTLGGTAVSSVTISYSRVLGTGSLPASPVWTPVDTTTSPVALTGTPPAANGARSVGFTITQDTSAYRYFFKVGNTQATGYVDIAAQTLPSVASIQKRVMGNIPGDATLPTRRTTGTYTNPALPQPALVSTTLTGSGSIPVLPFTSGGTTPGMYANSNTVSGKAMQLPITKITRPSVTVALVFRLNAGSERGFQSIFASGQTFIPGSLHILLDSGVLKIGMSGANWGGSGDNWEDSLGSTAIRTDIPYMLILTLDASSSTGKAKLRINAGATQEKTFNSTTVNNNIFGITTSSSAAESVINIGDWVSNTNGHRYLEGNVADVIVYDTALNNNEIITLEDAFRTRYTGNSVFGSSPSVSSASIAAGTTNLTYTLSGSTPAGVTIYYSEQSSASATPASWTAGPDSTVSFTSPPPVATGLNSVALTIRSPATTKYYFFKVEVSSTSSSQTSTALTVNQATVPTITLGTISATQIQYTLTSSTPVTAVRGYYRTPAATGSWVRITSNTAVALTGSLNTNTGATNTATINIPLTASARTFEFKIEADNSAGTGASATSSPVSVLAAPQGITLPATTLRSRDLTALYSSTGLTLVFTSTTLTGAGTVTLTGIDSYNTNFSSTITFSAPNASSKISTITGITGGYTITGGTLDFSTQNKVRLRGTYNSSYPFVTGINTQYIDFTV